MVKLNQINPYSPFFIPSLNQYTTVDRQFHIHVNPFWLSRVDAPIADDTLVNILTEPRWQDVIWLPRGRGRAVFRSRFTDYVG